MFKIIAVIALIFISFFPNNEQRIKLEKTLKEITLGQEVSKNYQKKSKKINGIEKVVNYNEISLSANAALFIDKKSGEIIYEKNIDKKLPIASLTKLMTAIIAIENIKEDEILTVPQLSLSPLDSKMWLVAGDKIKFSELLHGLLMNSGADAALTISKHISGNDAEFSALMNEKSKILGLNNTEFSNSVGWDSPNNRSTARDLINLANIALSNKTITNIVGKKNYTAISINGRKYPLSNTNLLLNGTSYRGIKTGTTFAAGECLVTYYTDSESEILGVILNSPSRFEETQNTINWIQNNYKFYGKK